MKDFVYHQPTEVRFGRGRVREAGEIVARFGKKCLLVTVPEFPAMAPLFARVKAILEEKGVAIAHFDGVIPNPTTDVVSAGARLARESGAEVVLGLGGGSSMDTAKAIAVEATHKGTCWDYLFFKKQPTAATLPVVAVTTTSGTGSHVTQVAVVTNPAERNKSALFNSILFPRVSIVDPELVVTAPKHVTATTGFDVFSHAFESYINPNGSPYTDLLALEAIRLVAANLPSAVRNGSDIEARTRMAWADTLGGLSIANAGVTLPHGIGMAMSGLYPHVAHGEALACVYPAIMRYTYASSIVKFAVVGRLFDPSLAAATDREAAKKFCDALEAFLKGIGLRVNMGDLAIPKDELKALAKASMILPDYKNHPRVATLDEILEILENSCRA
jgi:alcohol dehydrogenase class IV